MENIEFYNKERAKIFEDFELFKFTISFSDLHILNDSGILFQILTFGLQKLLVSSGKKCDIA
jgi:hypothetical protein